MQNFTCLIPEARTGLWGVMLDFYFRAVIIYRRMSLFCQTNYGRAKLNQYQTALRQMIWHPETRVMDLFPSHSQGRLKELFSE